MSVESDSKSRRPRRSKGSRLFAKWMRWLHIYLSMISFAVVLFFSVTGITLNHPTWFSRSQERFREASGTLEPAWVVNQVLDRASDGADQMEPTPVSELEVVEFLRQHEHVRGAVSAFTIDESQATVAFRGPAYSADVYIDRELGTYELTEMSSGFVALINDLHKGRDTGTAWSWLIDVSALLMSVLSVTGLALIFYIKRHRFSGLMLAALGFVLVVGIYSWLVPR